MFAVEGAINGFVSQILWLNEWRKKKLEMYASKIYTNNVEILNEQQRTNISAHFNVFEVFGVALC